MSESTSVSKISDITSLADKITRMARHHSCQGIRDAIAELRTYFGGVEDRYYSSLETTWELPAYYEVEHVKLTTSAGKVLVDSSSCPLSLWSYSPSFSGKVSFNTLSKHLLTDPERPEAILFGFRNQYRPWARDWGFSLPYNVVQTLNQDESYFVDVRTKFTDSYMAQYISSAPSTEKLNVILVGHLDHPCQTSDGLSGCLVNNEVVKRASGKLRHIHLVSLNSVEIIGSVLFIKKYGLSQVNTGFAISANGCCLNQPFEFQLSGSRGLSLIDKLLVLYSKIYSEPWRSKSSNIVGFREGWGNDEIAFEVPGVSIPCVGIVRRAGYYYHTHLDNMDQWDEESFQHSVSLISRLVSAADMNLSFKLNVDHLICLSRPEIGLYIEPVEVSAIKNSLSETEVFWMKGLSEFERAYLADNYSLLRTFMNSLLPFMVRNKVSTVCEISVAFQLPVIFVNNYLKKMEGLGMVEFFDFDSKFDKECISTNIYS